METKNRLQELIQNLPEDIKAEVYDLGTISDDANQSETSPSRF